MDWIILIVAIVASACLPWAFGYWTPDVARLVWRKVKPAAAKTDLDWARGGKCPDCHGARLLQGPAGGMSVNIACDDCHMEWNIGHGFGTGPLFIERNGPLTVDRARLFGIPPEEMAG